MEKKYKHMEMIQNTITKMASNSFSLKGWAVTLVAGIFVLADKDADEVYFLISYIPIVVFWALDSYYLMEERLFRALYDKVIGMAEDKIDFKMDTTPAEFHTGKNAYCNCFLSKTTLGFYFPLALIVIGVVIISQLRAIK